MVNVIKNAPKLYKTKEFTEPPLKGFTTRLQRESQNLEGFPDCSVQEVYLLYQETAA